MCDFFVIVIVRNCVGQNYTLWGIAKNYFFPDPYKKPQKHENDVWFEKWIRSGVVIKLKEISIIIQMQKRKNYKWVQYANGALENYGLEPQMKENFK